MTGTSFRVLGPVEVWRDGLLLASPTPRHRAVLAALLVDAGRTVPVDVIVDRVWSGQPPSAVSATLQAVVSRLRRELEPGTAAGAWTLLITRDPGYRLAVDPEDVDAVRFLRLLRAARDMAGRDDVEGARATVAEGLALWRGPAYADVAATFALEESERLEQARLDARELAAELDLRLGRHAELVDDLRELVRAEPLREGLRASLMLALYRAGRQAEALEVYAEGRRLLAEGLGVDPGRPLQTLHERILRQDPALAAPVPAPGAAPPPPATAPPSPAVRSLGPLPVPLTAFVGRARELGVLAAALTGRRLITLVGPGGSGKTRLALEAARRRPAGAAPAALVELAGVEDPDLVPAQVATVLGVSLTGGDPVGAVTTALQDRPLLLVLDNCEHVVDAAARLCAALLPRCPDLQVLATSREPLGLPGEAVLPCGPMPAGTPGSDAEQLFLDRARLAAPSLAEPSAEELRQVRDLCAALDGLPLAVELAAACLTTLPLAEVAARVDDRFALLSGGWRTAPPHQGAPWRRPSSGASTCSPPPSWPCSGPCRCCRAASGPTPSTRWPVPRSRAARWSCCASWSPSRWSSSTTEPAATGCSRRCGSTPSRASTPPRRGGCATGTPASSWPSPSGWSRRSAGRSGRPARAGWTPSSPACGLRWRTRWPPARASAPCAPGPR
jgi:DNA-binding SARP family transcriptional activator